MIRTVSADAGMRRSGGYGADAAREVIALHARRRIERRGVSLTE